MPVLTPQQVGAVWILAGGPREATADAVSEAYVESGFDTDAISPVGATGLWQIHPGGAQYRNPLTNGQAAVTKYRDGGNSFVKHWRNWQAPGTEAKRLAYLPRATIAASRVTRLAEPQLRAVVGGRQTAGFDLPSPTDPLGPLGPGLDDIPNPLDLFGDGGIPSPGDALDGIGNIAEILRGTFELLIEILKKLVDPDTWKDLGKILLGLILLSIGAKRLFTITTG